MPPKTDEIKNEKYHQNLEEYMKLVLETLDDENFEKYTEFSYLISMPKFHLLPEKIKNKALQHCHEHIFNYLVISKFFKNNTLIKFIKQKYF